MLESRCRSTIWLASITLVGASSSAVRLVILARRSTGFPIADPRLVRRSWALELARHSSTLVWWSIMMLAITGVDILVVGAFDFDKVGGYGVAVQGITFVIGVFSAMMAPITAVAARRHAERRSDEVGVIVVDSSRVGVTALVVISTVLFVAAPWIVELYAGSRYLDTTVVVLRILILGNVIRNLCFPLGLVLVATGDHRRVIAPPFAEAVVNLALSLWWVQDHRGKRGCVGDMCCRNRRRRSPLDADASPDDCFQVVCSTVLDARDCATIPRRSSWCSGVRPRSFGGSGCTHGSDPGAARLLALGVVCFA